MFAITVQPAAREDGWDYEPFVLTKSADGTKLYGRGSTDDKGPVCAWLMEIVALWLAKSFFAISSIEPRPSVSCK